MSIWFECRLRLLIRNGTFFSLNTSCNWATWWISIFDYTNLQYFEFTRKHPNQDISQPRFKQRGTRRASRKSIPPTLSLLCKSFFNTFSFYIFTEPLTPEVAHGIWNYIRRINRTGHVRIQSLLPFEMLMAMSLWICVKISRQTLLGRSDLPVNRSAWF